MQNSSQIQDRLARSEEIDARYERNKALVRKRQKLEAGEASALVLAAYAYGDALDGNRLFQMASHWAKLLCIAALFVIPNLLAIHVLF